jgi:ATP-binding cassette subfamily B multidrug efflux pump
MEVAHAADVAQAAEFITTLPDGYATMLSEGGLNLSGGQKQRLAMARALVRRPEIYVFDDSFSALDFKTDANLRAALKKETLDATVIIVAQRVGSIMNADRIIVLDEGKVAGIGMHKELMKTCEVYREIVYSQLSEEELA